MGTLSEIARAAAALIVEEGLGFGSAKQKALRSADATIYGGKPAMPSNVEVEAAIWEYIGLFKAETQPEELRQMRALALKWMQKLEAFNPHLGGGVWHGWAGKMNAIELELYCPEQKLLELTLLDAGVEFESSDAVCASPRHGRLNRIQELVWWDRADGLPDYIPVHARVYELDGIRGALLADEQGRSPRGTCASLSQKMKQEEDAA